MDVVCSSGGADLQCQAVASIKDLYVYCPREEIVTSAAVWTVGDPTVARVAAPGVLQAVGRGDTVVRASWQGIESEGRPVAVFPGTAPLPTNEIFGTVLQRGRTPADGAINGVVVEILDGLVAGRSTISGVPPPLLPGYFGPFGGAGYYRLLGVPPGSFRVRFSKQGFTSQERVVAVPDRGSPSVNVSLDPE